MSSSGAKSAGEHLASKILGAAVRPRGPKPAKKPAKGLPNAGNKAPATVVANATKKAQTQELAKPAAPVKVSQNTDDIIENAPRGMVLSLYKQLLRRSRSLRYTDQDFFARRMHQEFTKRKDAKDNNLYYIRGKWMLMNNLGGLL